MILKMGNNYVYIYLDPRKPGYWQYKEWIFEFEPFYVGRGKNDRMLDHLKPASRKMKNNKNIIIDEIFEANLFPLCVKLYDYLSFPISENIEIDIILHFGRTDLETGILANMTNGGDMLNKLSPHRRKPDTKGEKHWASKTVTQFSLWGEFIKKWGSLSEACEFYNASKTSISNCCLGKSKTSFGFKWKYEDPPYEPKNTTNPLYRKPRQKIYQYSLDGHFIKKYDSLAQASEETGFCNTVLGDALKSGRNISHFYQWFAEYKGEIISPVKWKTSRFRGVSATYTNFQTTITRGAKRIFKIFNTELEAAEAYDKICLYLNENDLNVNFLDRREEFLKENLEEYYKWFCQKPITVSRYKHLRFRDGRWQIALLPPKNCIIKHKKFFRWGFF